jgi:hypothetical protein
MAVHGAWQVDAVWFLGFLGFSTISDSRGRIFSANRHSAASQPKTTEEKVSAVTQLVNT